MKDVKVRHRRFRDLLTIEKEDFHVEIMISLAMHPKMTAVLTFERVSRSLPATDCLLTLSSSLRMNQ